MTPEQIETLDNALHAIEFHGSTFKTVYSGTPPNHPIIQLDGDFTIEELRRIVAACDAAMGTQQVVDTVKESKVFNALGRLVHLTRARINPPVVRPPIVLDSERKRLRTHETHPQRL